MFGSQFLEVAIGLVLLFLIVSLLCMALAEAIEGLLKARAMDVERGIRELLDDPTGAKAKLLFDHPLLFGLFRGLYDPADLKRTFSPGGGGPQFHMGWWKRRNLPSYIPAAQFAGALLDLVMRGALSTSGPAAAAAFPGAAVPPSAAAAAVPALPANAAGGSPVAGGAAAGAVPAAVPSPVEGLREIAARLPDEKLRRMILAAIDQGGSDLAAVRANLEAWFNGTMDRVSGWYKRRTQLVLFLLGMGVAVSLNIDAIEVARRLYDDDVLRQSVVGEASALVQRNAEAAEQSGAEPAAAPPVTTEPSPTAAPEAAAQPPAETAPEETVPEETSTATGLPASLEGQTIRELQAELYALGYPIGWNPWPQGLTCQPDGACTQRQYEFGIADTLRMLPGWLITALAAMLGAPFWFDILNKFMVIRSTVKPREKSREEGSEDRRA